MFDVTRILDTSDDNDPGIKYNNTFPALGKLVKFVTANISFGNIWKNLLLQMSVLGKFGFDIFY